MKSWCKWNFGLSVKRSFYFLLVLILSGCKSASDKDASGSIKKIILDSSQSKWGYDISPLLEQNVAYHGDYIPWRGLLGHVEPRQ